jgi:glycosyltransferase involved in cell wall biosynthesis
MLIQHVQIELSKPIEPIYVDYRYQRLFALVCWRGLPLGMLFLQCHPELRTFSAQQLQHEITKQFGWSMWEQMVTGALDRLEPRPGRVLPPISVVVCTRDRALSLKNTLASLAELDYPEYEVVVVDNCSREDATARAVQQSGFRYVREDRPGLDWARNRGVQEARFDIIAFIDDDAVAMPSWLRGIAYGFEDATVDVVTGMVLAAEIETAAQNDFEHYGGMSKGFIPYTIRRNEISGRDLFRSSNWGVGANMAFRRSVFKAIGGFDIALDVGTATCGGGDIEFFYRAVAAGHALRYEPAATIRHTHRRDHASLRRQIYNNGRSFAAYLMTVARNEPRRRRAVLWFGLRWWLWQWLIRRILVSVAQRDWWTLRIALVELWGACSAPKAYRMAQLAAAQQLLP